MADKIVRIRNFIDGRFAEPLDGLFIESPNPATGKTLCLVPDSCGADVALAVEAARKAFPAWSALTRPQRSSILNKMAEILERRKDEFALAESRDQGKTLKQARDVEIPRAIANFRYFAGLLLYASEASSTIDGVAQSYTQRMPIGIAGLISPWNLPLYLLTWKIAPALAAGNCVIAKPSELTSLTAFMLCECFVEAGIPSGVVNVIFGRGATAGQAIVSNPLIPLISFTGGTTTGQAIAGIAGPMMKKLSLELGGKNPNLIFADCDLNRCIETTVRSSFTNQGELCLCGSRIYVQQTIYARFLQVLVEATKKLKVGDPLDDDTTIGALISSEHLQKVMHYIVAAKEDGGHVIYGGCRASMNGDNSAGYFMQPTIITDLPNHSKAVQEEIFGPVVTIASFETEEEAVELANGTKYGLSASIWSSDHMRARRIAQKLHAGTVWINCWMVRDLSMPFGGMKASGIGREGGLHSLDFFTETKTICQSIQ